MTAIKNSVEDGPHVARTVASGLNALFPERSIFGVKKPTNSHIDVMSNLQCWSVMDIGQ